MTFLSLTAVFEPVEDGWVQARILELPAVITAGRTHDEAKSLLVDALRELVLAEAEAPRDGLRPAIPDTATTEALTLSVA